MATEKAIPRMGTLKEAAALAGIPYSAIRKMCITGKVVMSGRNQVPCKSGQVGRVSGDR